MVGVKEKKRAIKDHPFWQEADLIRLALRDNELREARGSINPLVARYMQTFGDIDNAIVQMKAEAAELRGLARRDFAWLDGEV
jgi:hypothetical protein